MSGEENIEINQERGLVKRNLLQKIRNKGKIIQTLIVLIVVGSVVALGIYYEIYELINLSAIVLGWFLATFTVNLFQKNRFEKEIRDRMFSEYNALANLVGKAIRAWLELSFKPDDEKRHYDVQTAVWNLNFTTETYVNRINNQFKLINDIEKEPLVQLNVIIKKYNEKILQSLTNKDFSDQMNKNLSQISNSFQKSLQMTLYIIQLAKFD